MNKRAQSVCKRSSAESSSLLTIRSCFKNLMNSPSSFSKNDECVAIFNYVSQNKDKIIQHKPEANNMYRFCNQNKYNILICGGWNKRTQTVYSKVSQIDGSNLESVKNLPLMKEKLAEFKGDCLKGEAYMFNGTDRKLKMKFEKYSPITNSWSKVADTYDDRRRYCSCAMMNKVFVIGGCSNDFIQINSCAVFDVTDNKWKEITSMNRARMYAACVVF